jgi:serine/threonine protein phosphatase PrpC
METSVRCPSCGAACRVEESALTVVRCRRCKQRFNSPSLARALHTVPQGDNAAGPRTVASFRFDLAGVTSTGRARAENEDGFLLHHLRWAEQNLQREIALAIVADGVGGHEAGETASRMLIHLVNRSLSPVLIDLMENAADELPLDRIQRRLHAALGGASREIFQLSRTRKDLRGMGATSVALLLTHHQVALAHVGDCRVCHYRAGTLNQVTRDHTRVAELVAAGKLSPQEAAAHPERNEITQAVGIQEEVAPSFHHLSLQTGDWLIAASDGLHEDIDPPALLNAIRTAPPSASALALGLVNLANQAGGSDNCTVVVVRCY